MVFVFLLLLIATFCQTNPEMYTGTLTDDSYEAGQLFLCKDGTKVYGAYTKGDNVVGMIRGTIQDPPGDGVLKGNWYEPYGAWGGMEWQWRTDNTGIDGVWWLADNDEEYYHFPEVSDVVNATVLSPRDCYQPESVTASISTLTGNYDNSQFLAFEAGTDLMVGFANSLFHTGQAMDDMGWVVSGTVDDVDKLGGFLLVQDTATSFRSLYFSDTILTAEEPSTTTTELNFVGSVTATRDLAVPGWDSGDKYSRLWNAHWKDGDENSYSMNMNGKLFGSYTAEGAIRGIYIGAISNDGLTASGHWYEPGYDGDAFGRMELTISADKSVVTGFWGILEDGPLDEVWSWSGDGDKYTTFFTNPDLSWVYDDKLLLGPASYYDTNPEKNVDVNSPFFFCQKKATVIHSLVSRYYDEIGYAEGKYYDSGNIGIGVWSEQGYADPEEDGVGAFLYIPTFNVGMKGFWFDFDETNDYNYTTTTLDGPYVTQETPPPAEGACDANKRVLPDAPDSDDTEPEGGSGRVIVGSLLFMICVLALL